MPGNHAIRVNHETICGRSLKRARTQSPPCTSRREKVSSDRPTLQLRNGKAKIAPKLSPFESLPLELQAQCFRESRLTIGENIALQGLSKALCSTLRSDCFWRLPYRGDFCQRANLRNKAPKEIEESGLFNKYSAAVRKIRALELTNEAAFIFLIRQQPMFSGSLDRPMGFLCSGRELYDPNSAMRCDWPLDARKSSFETRSEATGPDWASDILVPQWFKIRANSGQKIQFWGGFVEQVVREGSAAWESWLGRELAPSESVKMAEQLVAERGHRLVASLMPRGMVMACFSEHALSARALPKNLLDTFEVKFMLLTSFCSRDTRDNCSLSGLRAGDPHITVDSLIDSLDWLEHNYLARRKFYEEFFREATREWVIEASSSRPQSLADFLLKAASYNPSALMFWAQKLHDLETRGGLQLVTRRKNERVMRSLVRLSPWAYQRMPPNLQHQESFAFSALQSWPRNMAFLSSQVFDHEHFCERLFLWLKRRPGASALLVRRIKERGCAESICHGGHDPENEQRWAVSTLETFSRADGDRDKLLELWLGVFSEAADTSHMKRRLVDYVANLDAEEKNAFLQGSSLSRSGTLMQPAYRFAQLATAMAMRDP